MNLFKYSFLADEHIHPSIVLQMRDWNLDVELPFIIVAVRQKDIVNIRVRQQ